MEVLSIEIRKVLEKLEIFKEEVNSILSIINSEKMLNEQDIKIVRKMRNIPIKLDLDSEKEEIEEAKKMLEILEIMLTDKHAFTAFKSLSLILTIFRNKIELTDYEKRNLFFYLIEKNINMGILKENALIIERKYSKENINNDDIDIEELKNNPGYIELAWEQTKNIQKAHFIIKECYFDKKQKTGELKNFNKEDIEKIKLALINLNISEEMVNTIISTLKDKVSKEKTNMDFSYLKKDTQNKPKLSKKDYKKIDDELKKYFYFNPKYCNVKELNDSIIVYNSLNEREKMRCVFLLRKGGYDVSTIETFLLKAKISNLNNINLVDVYQNEFLLMFKEFSSKYDYAEKLIEINEIIKLISSLPNTSDEYLEWLEELKSLINTIDANISKKEKQEYVLKRIKIYEQKEIWN